MPYEQYNILTNLTGGKYEISFDFMTTGLLESPREHILITFEGPHRVGDMRINESGGDYITITNYDQIEYSPYSDNTLYEVKHTIDLDLKSWTATINGQEVFNSSITGDSIEEIQISLGSRNRVNPNASIRVDIQNFKIIQIPSTL